MPKRNDINKILVVGSGPIIIGQACEFDYSGTQACKVLREEGYKVILINSNPATIMTDFEIANKTYIEPITTQIISRIIEKETPDAILPTLGGQTGLNAVLSLSNTGVLKQFDVEVIGADLVSIDKAESRNKFKKTMDNIGIKVTKSGIANNLDEARIIANKIGFPLVIRASFTLGGLGSNIINNINELDESVTIALSDSPISQVILEESLMGWKEYELELMRDSRDNVIVVCSIENVDPVGVHTGDSITVAPIQTLTDKEYQNMRNSAIDIIREVGINAGGANVQFAINPKTGEMVVVEMNPRVSRSSALASKATGFPIAKISAKLAIGYTLDEIRNDITGITAACFEPSIDYCVVKIPVWDNDRFHNPSDSLSTVMRSVGETMAIGRTFKEALQKAIRSSGHELYSFDTSDLMTKKDKLYRKESYKKQDIVNKLSCPNPERLSYIYHAFHLKMSINDISSMTKIDSWFIFQLYQIFKMELYFSKVFPAEKIHDSFLEREDYRKDVLIKFKSMGFSDIQIARLMGLDEPRVAAIRRMMGINPVYKSVDTCAAEFYASTPYHYSTYESECEITFIQYEKKVIILGSGPNRIGQGIEFDYCCVHASLALREEGAKSIMVNNNPATVSTDYDVSDRLYFEPLTYEDVMNLIHKENPYGVIVQFGGQIPINLSKSLEKEGIPILGTKPDNINRAEDRGFFKDMLSKLGLKHPPSIIANSAGQIIDAAKIIGYPVILRPSFILGGESINIVKNSESLLNFVNTVIPSSCSYPVLVEEFLQDAMEVDVDVISDGYTSIICGIMEHVEESGIHSGDSACILPAESIDSKMINRIVKASKNMASELEIVGLMNAQYAIKDNELYVLEVNPRASRTMPFVSKATGIPFIKLATKIMLGKSLLQLGLISEVIPNHVSVKEAVFSFNRFLNSDTILGPSMKSTGEVMGIGSCLTSAYTKAQLAAGQKIPISGTVIIICCNNKRKIIPYLTERFEKLGFNIIVYGDNCKYEDDSLMIKNIENNKIKMIITVDNICNAYGIGYNIRKAALKAGIPQITTVPGTLRMCDSIEFILNSKTVEVKSLQDYHS